MNFTERTIDHLLSRRIRRRLPISCRGDTTLGRSRWVRQAQICVGAGEANHGAAVLSCLLALTLLMLSWLLAPPRECPQALPFAERRLADVIPVSKRRVSRSLAELSVCRT